MSIQTKPNKLNKLSKHAYHYPIPYGVCKMCIFTWVISTEYSVHSQDRGCAMAILHTLSVSSPETANI
jgi:hypothetical protein